MALIETDQLIGAALDWAVAKCEKKRVVVPKCWEGCTPTALATFTAARTFPYGPPMWSPSTSWAQGGPIITREMLGVMPTSDAWWRAGDVDGANGFGPTPLIAAMRCFVAATLGDSVEIPGKLLTTAA